MGFATVSVGLIPGYAQIGVAAPILLVALRLVQGLAVGGEVGGALLLVAETLNKERRGYWTAWPQIGGPAGNLASAGVFVLLTVMLSDTQFVAWGWRIAFLLSGLLIGIGVWMRTRVEESPLYRQYVEHRARTRTRTPIRTTLATYWRDVLVVLFVKAGENALFYVFTTFFVVYVTLVLHLPRTLALAATSVASAIDVVAIVSAGILSDKIGRRPVTAFGLMTAAIWAFVLFPATRDGNTTIIMLAGAIGGIWHGCIVGGMSAMFVELFPTEGRYTGFSVGYQFASVLSGAVAPLIGVALLTRYHSTIPVSCYAAAMTIPALIAIWRARETRGVDLAAVRE